MITVRGVREPIDAEIAAEQVKIRIVTGSTGAFIALLGTIILTSTVLDQDRNPVQDEGITLAARNAVQVFVLNEQQALELLRQAQAGQPVPATPASEEDLSAAESELLEFLQAGNGETDISASGTITPTTTTGSIGE